MCNAYTRDWKIEFTSLTSFNKLNLSIKIKFLGTQFILREDLYIRTRKADYSVWHPQTHIRKLKILIDKQ